ncbi:MAG: hypothetical protein FJ344_04660 [Sphingomonadales bacterium]|nr:hypothetical protein [Sphingomonadales bacterium]
MSHPLHARFKEKAPVGPDTELYLRRLVRSDRYRSEMQEWLEKGGMNYAYQRVKKAYEEAFFGSDNPKTPFSYSLNTPPGSAGFAFTLHEFMPAETHSLVLDCLVAQICALASYHKVRAERWISRDDELDCDCHQRYTLYPNSWSKRVVAFFMRCPAGSFLYLCGIHRSGAPPRIEIVWKGATHKPHQLHILMERWLKQSPEGRDFSYMYQTKNLIHRLWK